MLESILGGVAISIGCVAYLSVGGGITGAFLFSIGLCLICARKLNLFTGKVCYLDKSNIMNIMLVLIGNMIGVFIVSLLIRHTSTQLIDRANEIMTAKSHGWLNIILKGIMCNVLIFYAVDTYNKNTIPDIFKWSVLILCVMVFILSGYEHCIANAFYSMLSGHIGGLRFVALNVLGNTIGGVLIYRLGRNYGNSCC